MWHHVVPESDLLITIELAKADNDEAYVQLVSLMTPLIYDVYYRFLQSKMTKDEWYSEGLWVLMQCVRRYNLRSPGAKFSTYLTQALRNKATDILRQSYTQQKLFEQDMMYDETDADAEGLLTQLVSPSLTPEKQLMQRMNLQQLLIDMPRSQKKMLLALLGFHAAQRTIARLQKRQIEQLRYRTLRSMREQLIVDN